MMLAATSREKVIGSLVALAAVVFVGWACGGDDSVVVSSETGSTGDGTSADGASTGTDSGSSSTTGLDDDRVPARGISLDWVEANQGVAVPIGANGGPVEPADRMAALIANRRTLIRAHWVVDEDWKTREIEAQLQLRYVDGRREVLAQRRLVAGPSSPSDLELTFSWGLEADEVEPGLRYQVSLWETGEPEGDAPNSPPRLPIDGDAFVGVEDSYLLLKVIVVPFDYDDGQGCSQKPDTSDEAMQRFHDALYMQNPVDRVELTLHDPVAWNQPLEYISELLPYLSDLRFQEGAPSETFYYGVVSTCGGLHGGVAYGVPEDPTSPDAAYQRVAAGDAGRETVFVHEIGHTLGRAHILCRGDELAANPLYPHEGGDIGAWGFGVVDFELRHSTVNKDYMTYCSPRWVGPWGWSRVYPVIRVLSMWDEGYPGGARSAQDPHGGALLVGLILPNDEAIWHTVPGAIDVGGAHDEQHIEFSAGNRVIATRSTRVSELPDGAGESMVVAELPPEFETADSLTWIYGERRVAIDPSSVRRGHQPRETLR
jgi:hypothetical protein